MVVKKIIHKTISLSSLAMCGQCVNNSNKTNRWVNCNCPDCWKFARSYVREKYYGKMDKETNKK